MKPARILALAAAALPALARAQAAAAPQLTPAQTAHEWAVHEQNQALAMRAYAASVARSEALTRHEVAVYWTQLVFSIVLTLFVLGMVGFAVWMSYLQFKAAPQSEATSTFKLSRDGLEMSSSVIGLFVLLAAMIFFYIYVDKVYAIHSAVAAAAPAAPAAGR